MRTSLAAIFGLVLLPQQAAADEPKWQYSGLSEGQDQVLTYHDGVAVSYRFLCARDRIVVTQTGVTKLMDFATGQQVDDAAESLPQGASMMALYTGKGGPDFLPAQSEKNKNGGWDLSLQFNKRDKRLTEIGKSKMISLFTSGYTVAVTMDDSNRELWRQFLSDCRARK